MWIKSIGASGPQASITPGLVCQGSLDLFQQTEPDSISRSITDSVDDVGALLLSGLHVEEPFSEQFITGAKTTWVQIPIPQL